MSIRAWRRGASGRQSSRKDEPLVAVIWRWVPQKSTSAHCRKVPSSSWPKVWQSTSASFRSASPKAGLITHTDRKPNPPVRFPIWMLQLVQQLILMTGRIPPKILLGHHREQRRKRQRSLLGRHMAVPKLIGHRQVRLRPHRHHRLVAPAFRVMVIGRLLVTFNDRRVLIDRSEPLRLTLLFLQLGNPPLRPQFLQKGGPAKGAKWVQHRSNNRATPECLRG